MKKVETELVERTVSVQYLMRTEVVEMPMNRDDSGIRVLDHRLRLAEDTSLLKALSHLSLKHVYLTGKNPTVGSLTMHFISDETRKRVTALLRELSCANIRLGPDCSLIIENARELMDSGKLRFPRPAQGR